MSKRAVAFVHTRDIAAEQALVREKWKLVHANVKLDQALTAFLTQGLDNCGIKITQLAFELVQQILNPKGYVRLDHKSELSNIGALVRTSSSAWGERGQNIHTKWDFGESKDSSVAICYQLVVCSCVGNNNIIVGINDFEISHFRFISRTCSFSSFFSSHSRRRLLIFSERCIYFSIPFFVYIATACDNIRLRIGLSIFC